MTCQYCGGAKRIQIVSPVSDHAWADCFCVKLPTLSAQQAAGEAVLEKLRELLKGIEHPTAGLEWTLPWRVVPCDGKPIIASTRGGNLFRGYIGTWKEADLIVGVVNALPAMLYAAPQPEAPAEVQQGVAEVLSAWRPEPMTAETAPHWLKELTPAEYAARRNDENREAMRSLDVQKDWLNVAASMLHTAGIFSDSEFGSYGHSCLIVADALAGTRERLLALATPQQGQEVEG